MDVMKKGGDMSDMIEVRVTADMSRDDVVNGILKISSKPDSSRQGQAQEFGIWFMNFFHRLRMAQGYQLDLTITNTPKIFL